MSLSLPKLPRIGVLTNCLFGSMLLANMAAASIAASDSLLDELHWRLLGPFRGGWSTMAVGIADQPDMFYSASAGGGLWQTTDAGHTWAPIFEQQQSATIGALAIAPSDPKILYVGTGQPEPRYDIAAGDGVYKSSDGGQHWQALGLEKTRHIGAIWVDPQDPNTVVVAALGHMYGPNKERGIYRSSDGGASWQQNLFIDENTGVVDLAADPAHPDTLFAAAWQARNYPWMSYFTPVAGPGSAIYRSDDKGQHWQHLRGLGWPGGNLGRIGLAVCDIKNGLRVYASVDAGKEGGLYRSDDGGDSWRKLNDAKPVTSWYNSRLTVDPHDPDTVYYIGQSIHKSTDGGQHFDIIKGAPGGDDYHFLWINPKHAERMISASDQGTVITVNGGQSWSTWYNQPTGQFYHLATDQRVPYWIYAGQQDSGTVAIASRSDYGALSFRDWHPVGAEERDYDIPDPLDPNIVYGSGLGGHLTRWDARTGESHSISPWPISSYGARPTDVKYRYTWITPIAVSGKSLYLGAQVLFRSADQGQHWVVISPDLSAKSSKKLHCDGNLLPAAARDCGYGVIYSIAPSPLNQDEIWIGTDDGLIQLTRDAGQHWNNVTPPSVPAWAQISSLEPSPLQAGTAYAAVDNHRQDDFSAHVLRTHDFGKTWQDVTQGLPAGHFVSVVRADPRQAGLLFAGTDTGIFVSMDDGDHWQSLQHNLPTAWVRDVLVHDDDLIVATQGRAIWVLDHINPLRDLTAGRESSADSSGLSVRLFQPGTALRIRSNQNRDTPLPPETPLGDNPPEGAIIDYVLNEAVTGPITLEVRDAYGQIIRRFRSDDQDRIANAHRYFSRQWLQAEPHLSNAVGHHRFVWDLRYETPHAQNQNYSIGAIKGRTTPVTPQGPMVLPGIYQLDLMVDEHHYQQQLHVLADLRVVSPLAEMQQNLMWSRKIDQLLEQHYLIAAQQADLVKQLGQRLKESESGSVRVSMQKLLKDLQTNAGKKHENEPGALALDDMDEQLATIATELGITDKMPTQSQQEVVLGHETLFGEFLNHWQNVMQGSFTALNLQLEAKHLKPFLLPELDQLSAGDSGESDDMP